MSGRKTGLWQEGLVWGLEGTFERAFVQLFEAFGRPDTQLGNGKEFPTEQPNICYLPAFGPHTVLLGGGYYSQNVLFCNAHQYVIPIAQWAFCNARGNTSPTNQLHSPVRVVPDPFLLKVRGTTEVAWHCRGELQILNGTCQGRSSSCEVSSP